MMAEKIFSEFPEKISPQYLAFIGDAVYELIVRAKLIDNSKEPIGKINELKKKIVCCEAQSEFYEKIENMLTEEEIQIYKQGRNSNVGKVPKNSSAVVYRRATGVEALIGFLYLKGNFERLEEFLKRLNL